MKKFLLIFSIVLLTCFTYGCQNQQESTEKIPTPVTTKELTKWDMIVQKKEIKIGVPTTETTFDNQLIDAFAKEAELAVTKVPLNWDDDTMTDSIQNGTVDMLWGQIPATSNFSTLFRLSHPYFHSTAVYVANTADTPLEETTEIGVLKHSAEASMLKHYYKNITLYDSEMALFQSLATRQGVVVVYNKSSYENMQIKKDAFHIIKETPYDLVVAFEQNNSSVSEEAEKIIAKIKADGTASDICRAWYPEDLITK